jgi:sodium-dependent dicarboxylate transporter 2/3/5
MTSTDSTTSPTPSTIVLLWLARVAGPLGALAVYALLSSFAPELSHPAKATAAIGTLMAVWWMSEALPLPVTSLLPLVLFPLSGALALEKAAVPYANKYIFLYMGGFMLALAVEKWNLHRRIALLTVLAVGTGPARLVGGFMLATAFLSMWMSNTATAVLMLPIGLSLVHLLTEQLKSLSTSGNTPLPRLPASGNSDAGSVGNEASAASKSFAVCMMLGIAYASSIGGMATLVGTPTNAALAGFAAAKDISVGFGSWMLVALPAAAIYLVCAWLLLTRVTFPIGLNHLPGGRELIRAELAKLGRMSRGETIVLAVFGLTALAWITREPLANWNWLVARLPLVARLDDTIIVLIAVAALFFIPVDPGRGVFALDWKTAERLPWGVLLLFGGGLSLAAAVEASQLAEWIGRMAAQEWLPPWALVILVTAAIIFLTELTSNTATLTTFLPVLYGVAQGLEIDPLLVMIPATIAASCAFMLPAGTPPNAIVFGTGHVSIRQMCWAGWWLNLLGILLIPLATYTLGKWVFGIP